MAIRVTLGGIPLLLGNTITWPNTAGVSPVQQDFEVPKAIVGSLLDLRGKPVELVITPDSVPARPALTIASLFIIGEIPSSRPTTTKIRVVDRRYWWPRKVVRRRYNMRRKVGAYRLTHPDAASGVDQLAPVADQFFYWKWSLFDQIKTPWTAPQILEDVIKLVLLSEPDVNLVPGGGLAGGLAAGAKNSLPKYEIGALPDINVENVEIDASGDAALTQALRYVPDAKLYLRDDGTPVIDFRNSDIDEENAARIGAEKWGQGHVEVVDNSWLMPSKVIVYFDYECEVMFRQEESATDSNITQAGVDNSRTMDNVIPVPDPQITINSVPVVQGTFVTFDDYLAGQYVQAGTTKTISQRISKEMVRIACTPFNGLWGAITDSTDVAFDPDNNWPERIAAIQDSYRRLYRLNPNWVDRCFGIRAYRVATVDPTKGQRANAAAWQNFCVVMGKKGFARYHNVGKPVPRFVNVSGYLADGEPSTGKIPPGELVVEDHDQGIVRVVFRQDVYKNAAEILPSMVTGNLTANAKMFFNSSAQPVQGQSGVSAWPQIAFNAVLGTGQIAGARGAPSSLSASHQVAMMLTLIPATNNLFPVEVMPHQAASMLPPHVAAQIGFGKGPPIELHVGAGVETARVMWSEKPSDKEEVEKLFQVSPGTPNVKHLVVNYAEQADIKNRSAASLPAIARAIAARIYAQYATRLMGRKVGRLTNSINPSGWIDTVTHGVTTGGETFTAIEFPDHIQQLDFMSLLPPDTRAIILREVHRKPA